MSLLTFIRLLLEHAALLVLVPIVMAVAVFLFTQNESKTFASHTTVYTGIASGYTIESGSNGRSDYHAVNNAFDNLINIITMRETLEEVAVRLMTSQAIGTLAYPDEELNASLEPIRQLLPARDLRQDSTALEAIRGLVRGATQDPTHPLYTVIHAEFSPFSFQGIRRNLKVKRIGTSDLLELRYSMDDAPVCQATLEFLLDVFIAKYTKLKEGEASNVIAYFEKQVEDAHTRLQAAVEERRAFGVQNRVINYYEQTKAIAGQKESIDETLQRERTRLAAAQSALQEVERKLGFSQTLMAKNEALNAKRKQLSALTAEAVLLEGEGRISASLNQRIDTLKAELQAQVRGVYASNYSKEGLTKSQLLNQWLSNVLVVAETEASVTLLQQRYADYQQQYDVFAPLGSMLATLDRQVDIAENEYLEHLHSLNQARMRQQNIQLSSKLDTVDPPFLPLKPAPSKRLQLIALAGMAGIVLCIGGIIAREYLDQTIRTPERGEALTSLSLASAYPHIHASSDAASSRHLVALLTDQLLRAIKLQAQGRDATAPLLIVICSNQPREGKTYVARQLVKTLRHSETSTAFLFPKPEGSEAFVLEDDELPYLQAPNIMDIANPQGLVALPNTLFRPYEAVVVETQALLHHRHPSALLQQADFVLFVTRADRSWSLADQRVMTGLIAALPTPPQLFVNAVKPERLEPLIGEVPKKRSALRRYVKRVLQFQLESQNASILAKIHEKA